ncbi:molybdopterin molybdotransferase MoeA [Cellulomonas denverensis]|uniref:Molybdopterin molybdenumtransferase n=1 Tax=Cellulomonas denverensis TaxID=264297 RepID=A0A7X6QY15_9CELL|nr:gephyrin-like molybdotransferase Glp [Cellulomonas denverensis]NKY21653.1 molybdopterin molybdotransferase MoeA [Cellulomonas denverensis]GIG25543.1 molybdopterin molybdenumtransferase [Cellulomonas denverensis]
MAGFDRTVAEHRAAVLADLHAVAPVSLPIAEARGLVAATPVRAAVALPGFDNAAMDGYAIRLADVTAPGAALPVSGDIPAGSVPAGPLAPGTACRIMTGAPVPDGTEAIVPVEDTDRGTDRVRIDRLPRPGAHLRRRGEDVAEGATVLDAGQLLTPPRIGLLAAVGRPEVLVHPRPRVLVLSTGAELVPAGRPLPPGTIHDANGPMLAAELDRLGAQVLRAPIAGDRPGDLLAALAPALDGGVDLVVTSAGVSAGAYDVVKQDLAGQVEFVRVAMQPGKPQGFGLVGPHHTPVLTLPGNPVSAWVSLQVFVRPALDLLAGRPVIGCPGTTGVLTAPLESPAGREQFLRARTGTGDPLPVTPLGGPGSHLLGSLAHADALVVVPADRITLAAGDSVDVLLPLTPTGSDR